VFALRAARHHALSRLSGKATEDRGVHRADARWPPERDARNLAELIITILALRAGLVDLVKASIRIDSRRPAPRPGSRAARRGLRHKTQRFSVALAGSASRCRHRRGRLVIPALFHATRRPTRPHQVSIGVAALLMVGYGLSLVYSMGTHRSVFEAREVERIARRRATDGGRSAARWRCSSSMVPSGGSRRSSSARPEGDRHIGLTGVRRPDRGAHHRKCRGAQLGRADGDAESLWTWPSRSR
jgi:hypothetical protein